MSCATRRSFTAEERATILLRHLADKVAVSDLCDEHKIQPSLFYVWQRQLMENMAAALEDRRIRAVDTRQATASSGPSTRSKPSSRRRTRSLPSSRKNTGAEKKLSER